MKDIQSAIENKIKNNKDKRLSIQNLVVIALDEFTTQDICLFYSQKFERDLRYFLEERIKDSFTVRNEYEKLNTH